VRCLPLLGLVVFVASGCETRGYPLTYIPDGGNTNQGGDRFNTGFGQAGRGGITGSQGGAGGRIDGGVISMTDARCMTEDICNGLDDNCDGKTDEGFNLQLDPANCGVCGKVCAIDHAFSTCSAGACVITDCLPGYIDADGKLETGCECLRTNGGVELCDGIDNDCDGKADEDFDLLTSLNHCGGCGNVCEFPYADSTCGGGNCSMGVCDSGRIDLNQKPSDGCEYSCKPTIDQTERCDGIDNDCDGGIDNSPVDEGAACGPNVVNTGRCKRGILTCTSGTLVCVGAVQPQPELCDNLDNNCDGSTDEGYNKVGDVRFCGDCNPCKIPNAAPRCNVGMCEIQGCSPGWVDLANGVADGCEYACTFRGLDVCNNQDDDCDGTTDEGINVNTDPNNCGGCGRVCNSPNAADICDAGSCVQGACEANFHDNDPLKPGCEYFCVVNGTEACDGIDNDCNGQIDEGINLNTDASNCGACGRRCQFTQAAASCGAGACSMGACNAGFVDGNNNPNDGCEYACTPTNGGLEICDGLDNDCDKQMDEADPLLATNCFPMGETGCDVALGTCAGTCQFGKYACFGGQLECQSATLPGFESCDNLDNDCDGSADEDFDKDSDPRFCGSCATSCAYTNAIALCSTGGCQMGPCKAGYVDLANGSADGCEYACTITGPELCDGVDNDCDGKTDGLDNDMISPSTNFCRQGGTCLGSKPVCQQLVGMSKPDWVCDYNSDVQTTAPNIIVGQEFWCDGKDNDCDGAVDEQHPTLGSSCNGTGLGNCPRVGALRCQSDKTLTPTCDVTGVPLPTALNEICDAKDNDCDGLTDEPWDNPTNLSPPACTGAGCLPGCAGAACLGVRDSVVQSGANTWMHQYEASRPDAKVDAQGISFARACSRGGVLPWSLVNYDQAQAACAAGGMRLCRTNRTNCASVPALSSDEWGAVCGVGQNCSTSAEYPYSCTYSSSQCNGAENGVGAVLATGNKAMCTSGDADSMSGGTQSVNDLSGNLAEWTEDCRGTLAGTPARELHTLRGGAYDSDHFDGLTALRCDFMGVLVAEDYSHPTAGFRCCSSCPQGQAYCGGGCRNLANTNNHCGACGVACSNGRTCRNGSCL